MMRRKSLQAIILLALPAILLGLPLLLTSHRIRFDMLEKTRGKSLIEPEYDELFGVGPGFYDGYEPSPRIQVHLDRPGQHASTWCSRYGWIVIWFDAESKPTEFFVGPSAPVTWWAKLTDRFSSSEYVYQDWISKK